MTGTASSWRQVGRVLVLAAVAVVVRVPGWAGARAAEAVEASAMAPKIVGARIGLKNVYKLGCWTPVEVEVANAAAGHLHVNVEVVDSDGVPTTATAPVGGNMVGGRRTAVVYTQAGRVGSPIRVTLANEERVLDVSL